ncbi:exported hypothetical protein [Rhodococcus sp. RD6.2]|nr:exported hypothetical protein [Rhodococcus sp. RD6.2]
MSAPMYSATWAAGTGVVVTAVVVRLVGAGPGVVVAGVVVACRGAGLASPSTAVEHAAVDAMQSVVSSRRGRVARMRAIVGRRP